MKKLLYNKYTLYVLIAIIISIAIYLYVQKKKKEKQFGILMSEISGEGTATGTKADLPKSDAFDQNYWKKFPDFSKKHNMGGKEGSIVKDIYESKQDLLRIPPIYSDNEKKVVSIFSKLKSKSEVSYIAHQFNAKYNKRLVDFLNEFMNNNVFGMTDYMAQIHSIVSKLPEN